MLKLRKRSSRACITFSCKDYLHFSAGSPTLPNITFSMFGEAQCSNKVPMSSSIITVGAAPTAFANIGNWFYLLFIGLMLFIALPVFYFQSQPLAILLGSYKRLRENPFARKC
jgi:precorrin isomerase